jgi:hypothetical protein
MRIFHELLADDWIDPGDTSGRGTEQFWGPALGAMDGFRFFIVADCVVGSADPLLYLAVYESPDLIRQGGVVALLNNVTLVRGRSTSFTASATDAAPMTYSMWLGWSLSGASGAGAHIRIWATGRGRV